MNTKYTIFFGVHKEAYTIHDTMQTCHGSSLPYHNDEVSRAAHTSEACVQRLLLQHVPYCTIDGTPGYRSRCCKGTQDQAIQRGGGGSCAVQMMCHVDNAHSELWQPAYRPPQATFARRRLSAQGSRIVSGTNLLSYGETLERIGSERIETTIRKRQLGGSCSARRLKALKANHVWAAGGSRA